MKKISFFKPSITNIEIENSAKILKSGFLTTGPVAKEFEEKFSKIIGSKYTFTVNSCTSALHLAVEAIGIKCNDKVFVPSMTFVSSVEVLRYKDAHPIFIDIDYSSLLVTPEILIEAINKNPDVKYLMIVHFGGQSADMDKIRKICVKNKIKIIEDCAHAFPSLNNGKYVGSDSEAACFSFYANKTITTGEGGMLTTNNEEIAKKVSTLRIHGFSRDVWSRYSSNKPNWEYDIIENGFKYNMPDINAILGISQLDRCHEDRLKRQKIAEFYFNSLSGLEMIDLPKQRTSFESNSWHLFTIVINEKSRFNRDEIISKLSIYGIGTSVHYKPVHLMSYYQSKYKTNDQKLPNTIKYWKGCISLPIYPLLQEDDLEYICSKIKSIFIS